ncbi:hypothetical protein ANANG_G00109990, partial [Anguilla anguilla]
KLLSLCGAKESELKSTIIIPRRNHHLLSERDSDEDSMKSDLLVIYHKVLGSSSKLHRLSDQCFLHCLQTVEHHSWRAPDIDTVDLPIAFRQLAFVMEDGNDMN